MRRRAFLKAGTGWALAAPVVIPSGCVAYKGRAAKRPVPSGRVTLGLIGCGVMGLNANLKNFLNLDNVQVVSVCDPVSEGPCYGYKAEMPGGREPGRRQVNAFYAEREGKAGYNGCRAFADFREMLDDRGLDAVCVTTPDHWHALIGIWAARKGKHIYGQKPLANSVAEGRALCEAVRKHGVVFQTGSQGRSSDPYRRIAAEFIRNRRLGRLHKIELGLPGTLRTFGKTEAQLSETPWPQPPPYVDFDLWLGPAPVRPYIPKLHLPMQWRNNFDYGGGMLTDHGAHFIDVLQWALGTDETGPVAIENLWGELDRPESLYNVAPRYSFEIVYADGTRVHASTEFGEKQNRFLRFHGENDRKLYVCAGKLETTPAEMIREKIRDDEVKLYVSGNHERNFIEGILTGKPVISPCETGHRTITIAHLANIGLRLGRKTLKWDPVAERFLNDPEADRLLGVAYRKPWSLAV
ncbi:MAG: Gfo/Idh/MocA family oxidoreductase [Kiritimatiellia bacterium]|jgi:predicted dehydrogenase|nr:Gfo/Idh/MocA family oxidoreductase [Kiritimatiellia bacterium]